MLLRFSLFLAGLLQFRVVYSVLVRCDKARRKTSFGITLVLLGVSLFAFKSFDWADYILIGIGTIELIRIIATVVKLKKSAQS